MTATYTFDVFSSLDAFGAATGEWTGYWGKQPEVTYLMGAKSYRPMSGFAAGETPEGADESSADEEASVGGLTGASEVVFR
jgi:hypothetical protein